jgi:carbon-monoxide dehydrogenase medium subunit
MIPNQFDYFAATSVDHAVSLLTEHGDRAKVLAGGHSLLPLMKLSLAAPEVLVDISRIPGLNDIHRDGDQIVVGALCTYRQLESSHLLGEAAPLVGDAASQVGDPQVRSRGTIGGSLANADPAADMPAVALALDAELVARGPSGARTIAAREFFRSMLTTALATNELLTEVRFRPFAPGTGSAYWKYPNPASRYAVVGVAVVVQVAGGACAAARVGITGAGAVPVRAAGVEAALTGKPLDAGTIAAAADHAPDGVDLISDLHASADYRAQLLRVYTRRALTAATARAS